MTGKPFRAVLVAALSLMLGVAHAQDSDDTPAADPPDRAARLAYLRGDVSLQPAGEEEWAPALLNRPLTTGDKLWTEKGARVEIQVAQSAVRLDGNTGFSFLELGDDSVQMRITAGTMIVDVRALDGREQIEIDTPNIALAILRPGSYRIEVDEAGDATTVKIGEGEAEANGPSTNALIHSEQSVTFRGVDELVAQWGQLGAADDFDRWSMERERGGERHASSRTAEYVSPEVTGYRDLDEYGTWSSEAEYGYVWTPRVSIGWSPYRFGRWVWVSPWGWTWIDDSPWGYAPFHYGRWAHVRNRWCWVPGPRHVRAVYAPALVGWVGSRGSYVSWVPLGPRDVYVPGRRFSRHYWERVNFANARSVDRRLVHEFFEHRRDRDRDHNFHNRGVPDAITAVPRNSFTGAQRVGERRIRFNEREMAGHDDDRRGPQLRPVRESRLGGVARANPRIPASVAARQVIVKREPPAASARFARRPAAQPQTWQTQREGGAHERGQPRTGDLTRGNDRKDQAGWRTDRPRVNRDAAHPAAEAAPGNRVREARERDAPQRAPEQYPQYSQRPRGTRDAVREAVARQLEQRERNTPRSHDDRPSAEYRQENRRETRPEAPPPQPRPEFRREREQPRMEQPRSVPQRSEPRPQPQRSEPARSEAPRAERPRSEGRSERSSPREPRPSRGDGNRPSKR